MSYFSMMATIFLFKEQFCWHEKLLVYTVKVELDDGKTFVTLELAITILFN